jgi:hypothetical protein
LSLIDGILYKHLAEYKGWSPHNELTRELKVETRAAKRQDFRGSIKRTMWSGSKREGWARRSRRHMYAQYQGIEAYEDLRAAFERRVAEDPVLADGTPGHLVRLKIGCQRLFDHAVDAVYQLRYGL